MKVLQLNTFDISGGAARAAYRLHNGLINAGISSQLMVQSGLSNDKHIIQPRTKVEKAIALAKPSLDSFNLSLNHHRPSAMFSVGGAPFSPTNLIHKIDPDIIHLHWINWGFINIQSIGQLKKPIVWTIHDMWPFTGGCHYDEGCGRFVERCGACPIINSSTENDISRRIYERKLRHWKGADITVVSPSKWLADEAKKSTVFGSTRVVTIPNGIDLTVFKPIDRKIARQILNLPTNKRLILFGAMGSFKDTRKGGILLLKALNDFQLRGNEAELIVFGARSLPEGMTAPFNVHFFDEVRDDYALSLLYSAADVFVAPSKQDNLPNTLVEATACGTPCVAFDVGGVPDIVLHKRTGYLAKAFDIADLASGISWVFDNSAPLLRETARQHALDTYCLAKVSRRYLSLYESLM